MPLFAFLLIGELTAIVFGSAFPLAFFHGLCMTLALAGWLAVVAVYVNNGYRPPSSLPEGLFVAGVFLMAGVQVGYFFADVAGAGSSLYARLCVWAAPLVAGSLSAYGVRTRGETQAREREAWAGRKSELEALLGREPGNPFALCELAGLYEKAGRWGEALDTLRKASALDSVVYKRVQFDADERRLRMWLEPAPPEPPASLLVPVVVLAPAPFLFYMDWQRALNIASLWLFAAWCQRSVEMGCGRSS